MDHLFGVRDQRDLTDEEAGRLARAYAWISYFQTIADDNKALLARVDSGAFGDAASVTDDDLSTARGLALAMADELFPGQTDRTTWASVAGEERWTSVTGETRNLAATLAILLQPRDLAGFRAACRRATALWDGDSPRQAKMAEMLRTLAWSKAPEAEQTKHRATMEDACARAVSLLWIERDR
jgi:hypothetical protein